MHVELDYLRNIRDEKVRSDREYMTWSLGGGMVEAVFAGMRLREEAGQ
ncbi:MAG: hypothetical protein GY937_01355 [bacterium]|nr:hypothetical protein [bacterium]